MPDRQIPTLLIVLGGLLTALAFPLQPIPMLPSVALWPLVFIGPAPFLARLLTATTYGGAVRAAIAFGIPWMFVAGVWIFRVFDALGWVLIWLPVVAVVLFAIAAHATRKAGLSPAWSWPLMWVSNEFIRSEWTPLRINWFSSTLDPLNFSWFGLGHPRLVEPIFAQTADLGGGYFLAVAPLLTSLTLAWFWTKRQPPVRLAISTIVLCVAEVVYGGWQLAAPNTGPMVNVGVVQSERFQLSVLMELTAKLLAKEPETHLVVWPEESFTGDSATRDALHRFAKEQRVSLAVGVEAMQDDGSHRNMVWWLPHDGEPGEYFKRLRVPFVEQHPPSDSSPTFRLTVGDSELQVGILICYDMDFAWNPRQAVAAGAELLLMPALDEVSWGGTEHSQHALLPRLRAIENRRAVVEAATSGVSQIIDDRGRVLARIPYRMNKRPDRPTVFLEDFAVASVSANSEKSVYGAGGWLAGPVTAVLASVVLLASLLRKNKS